MYLFKRELKAGLKPFIFWSLGLFVLVFAGITKFTGIAASGGNVSITKMVAEFPRVVLAVLGMVGVDITTLGGYYSLIVYFVTICAVIYALYLGSNAVSREAIDKTYEFIFTKPCSRFYILRTKLLSGFCYLLVFGVLHFVFSLGAVSVLKFNENITTQIMLSSIAVLLVSTIFFALAAFLSAWIVQAEKGIRYGNLCFLITFVVAIIYDMFAEGEILKIFTPFKYFLPGDLLNKKLDFVFVAVSILFTALFLIGAFIKFGKKDLNAS